MPDLIAVKMFTYATRRLMPGQDFIARTPRDARLLIAMGKARAKRAAGQIAPPPPELAAKIAAAVVPDNMAALRASYEVATGKRPFMGWSADQLRARIDEAHRS